MTEPLTTLHRSAAYAPTATARQAGATPLAAPPTADGLFGTLLDVVNPLQHLPGVSTAYQEATGDTMSAGASILGGGLFGGLIGAGVALVAEAFKAATGDDPVTAALDGAQALVSPDPVPAGTPLVPDDGTAAREAAGLAAPPGEPFVPTPARTVGDLGPYEHRTLNLDKPGMTEQTDAGLDAVALRMA